MARARVRLKDIAESTGFSANTVSLALRGSPRIPEETRSLIAETAQRLNYFPNHIARSLVSRATRTIGLVMTDIMNPTLTLAARTIERQLSIAGYGMMFAASDTSVENEKRALGLFQSYQVDGILIYPANHKNLSHIKAVEEAGYPVLVLADLSLTGIDVVAIDDREGAYKAISHVLSKGHRQIAMLDGGRPLENTEKLEGALRALADRGLATNCLQVLDPRGHSAEQGYLAMGEAIGLNPRPTALFASTDSLAIGAVRWCRDKGLAVPRDMAIVGYDNTEASEFCSVPLTTVNYAADEVSRLAVDRIISKITTRPEPETPAVRLIEPELIVREST